MERVRSSGHMCMGCEVMVIKTDLVYEGNFGYWVKMVSWG